MDPGKYLLKQSVHPRSQLLLCTAASWLCPPYRRLWLLPKNKKLFHGYLWVFFHSIKDINVMFSDPRKFCIESIISHQSPHPSLCLDQCSSKCCSPVNSSSSIWEPVKNANFQDPPQTNESNSKDGWDPGICCIRLCRWFWCKLVWEPLLGIKTPKLNPLYKVGFFLWSRKR